MGDAPTADTHRTPRRVLERFSANFVGAWQDAGLTQGQLVERSELHHTQIRRLKRGVNLPHIGTLVRLAAALGVPPAELCAGIVWDPERQRFE
jgi:ribosome-binding protein aMBF1 (putative translation factor)